MGYSKTISKREFQRDECLLEETRQISNKRSNFTLQGNRKRMNKTQNY